jgi:hypothetical protein
MNIHEVTDNWLNDIFLWDSTKYSYMKTSDPCEMCEADEHSLTHIPKFTQPSSREYIWVPFSFKEKDEEENNLTSNSVSTASTSYTTHPLIPLPDEGKDMLRGNIDDTEEDIMMKDLLYLYVLFKSLWNIYWITPKSESKNKSCDVAYPCKTTEIFKKVSSIILGHIIIAADVISENNKTDFRGMQEVWISLNSHITHLNLLALKRRPRGGWPTDKDATSSKILYEEICFLLRKHGR